MKRAKTKKSKLKTNNRNIKKTELVDKGLEILHKDQEKRRNNLAKSNLKKKTSKKRHVNNKQKTIIILIILIIIVLSIINNYHKLGIVFVKDISEDDAIKIITTSSNNIIKEYQNEILVYSAGKYTTYNKYGKKTWQVKLDTIFVPEINTAGQYIQICNKSNGYIFVYYNKYESARIKIEGTIKSSTINEKGTTIVEYAKAGSKTVLGIYNNKGEQLYKIKLNTSIVGQYVLSNNSRYLVYTDVITDGISVSTNVNVIDLKKANSDNYQIPTIMKKDNDLIYKLLFDGNKVIALFGDKVWQYNLTTQSQQKYDIPNINLLNIDINSKRYIYVYSKDKEYILSYLEFGAEKSNDIILKEIPTNIVYYDGLIYLGYKKTISIYNSFGSNIKNYKSENMLTSPIVFNYGKSVAVPTSNQIIIFNI